LKKIINVGLPQTDIAVFELKFTEYGKKLQFYVSVHTTDGKLLEGKSIVFCSHNNGKLSVLSDEIKKKRKLENGEAQKDIINKIESPDPVIDGNLQVTGYVKAQAFFQFSDLRLKTNVEDLVGALDIISNLKGKSYQWKADQLEMENDGVSDKKVSRTIGLIAQEVQLVIPEVVKVDPETGLLSVSYVELIPVIIEALKEFMRNIENSNQILSRDMQDVNMRLQKLEKENPESNAKTSKYIQLYRDTVSPSVHMPLGSLIFAFLLLMVGTILLIIYLQEVSTYNEASSILHQKKFQY